MNYIQMLPFELLCRVFELGVEDLEAGNPSRTRFLCASSLICKHWRAPAQSVLLRRVRLSTQSKAHALLSSPLLGSHATHELLLDGIKLRKGGVTAVAANRVLQKVYGVQSLEIRDFQSLGVKVFENECFHGLQRLLLASGFLGDETKVSALQLPFRLRTLVLLQNDYPPALLHKLLSTSAHYLNSLSISLLPYSRAYPALVQSFHLIAPSLTHLDLFHPPTPALTSELRHCTKLSSVTCVGAVDVMSVIPNLTSASLKYLAIAFGYESDLEGALTLIHESLTSLTGNLRNLRRLDIRHPAGPRSAEEGALESACQEIGVDLRWSTSV